LSQALSYQLVRQLSATTREFLADGKKAAFVDERPSLRTFFTPSFHGGDTGEAPLVDLERAHSHRRRFPTIRWVFMMNTDFGSLLMASFTDQRDDI